jgi:hypothetical protein
MTTPDDARVRTLVDVDLTTVLDLDGADLRFRPRTDWRTFDGQPLTDDQADAVLAATSEDLRAAQARLTATVLELHTEADWLGEFSAMVEPYLCAGGTVGDALAAMPDDERSRAIELARLAGIAS